MLKRKEYFEGSTLFFFTITVEYQLVIKKEQNPDESSYK